MSNNVSQSLQSPVFLIRVTFQFLSGLQTYKSGICNSNAFIPNRDRYFSRLEIHFCVAYSQNFAAALSDEACG